MTDKHFNMNPQIKKNLEKYFKRSMKNIEQMFATLYEHTETRPVIEKLESMHEQFFYNCFSEVFTGFKSVYETESTLTILINSLLDDMDLYFEDYISNQTSLDISSNNPKLKDKIKPTIATRLTFKETDRYVTSENLLEFIDSKEKIQIKSINSMFNFDKRNKTLEDALESSSCWWKYIDTFNVNNLIYLEPELKKFFKVKS